MLRSLLMFSLLLAATVSNAQIVVQGISPAPIANSYNFTWADPNGGDWSTPDFNVPGTFVQDTIMLVEDGSPGVSTNGHNLSNEGCNPLINNLTGKIAIIYRGSCEFGIKALNAEVAGAVGVILINNDATVIGIGGGLNGLNVTIPVVMINNADGNALVSEIQNGPVVMFLGNQNGASSNDIGCIDEEILVSPYGGGYSGQYDGFELGLTAYNYGTNIQNNVTVNAQIVGPSGILYDETIGPLSINPSGNEPIMPGNTNNFPAFDLGVGNYPIGNYTLTYTLDLGGTDDFPGNNVKVYNFSVDDKALSLSRADANGQPIANNYPSNSTFEYQSCMMVQESNFNGIETAGVYFIPHTDTAQNTATGSEIFANVYQWDDAWTDLNDPNYQFDPATNDAYQNLNLISFGVHYIASENEVDQVGYIPLNTPVSLNNGNRYLVCLQTFDPVISFGYDDQLEYSGNVTETAQPVAPVHIDGSWYTMGWSGLNAPSIALNLDSTCLGSYVNVLYANSTCQGQNSGELAIETIGFGGAPSIIWDNMATEDTLFNLGAGTYTGTISDTLGCSMSISVTIDAIQLHVTPSVTHETCDLSNDGSIEVLSVTNGVAPLSYDWNTMDTTQSIYNLDSGPYSVTVTDANGCVVTENFNVGAGNPTFGIAIQASPDWGAPPMQVTFSNQTPNAGNYDFTWYFGDGMSEQNNASSVEHTYTIDGIWDVTVVATDTATGCMDSLTYTSLVVTNSNVGQWELEDERTVSIYPNPSNNAINIATGGFEEEVSIVILDLTGKPVYSSTYHDDQIKIDLEGISCGVYVIQVSDQSYIHETRLIKN